jgi:hypothetical protein
VGCVRVQVHNPRQRQLARLLLLLALPRLQLLVVERCHTAQPLSIVQQQQRQVLLLLWTF